LLIVEYLGIGDWGLGIAQSPINNPKTPHKEEIKQKIIKKYNIQQKK